MAYILNPNLQDEEEKKLKAQEGTKDSGGIIGGGAGTPPPPADKTPSASGSFTNLQRYLDENRAGAIALGEKVAGSVRQAGEEAKTASEDLSRRGSESIESGRVKQTSVLDEAAQNPDLVAKDAQKRAEFLRERDASYSGPAGLEDVEGYDTTQAKLKAAQDKINLAGTEEGRMNLLRGISQSNQGKGKEQLDQFLLTGNPESANAIQHAGDPYKNLSDYLTAQSDEARKKAAEAAAETDATRKAVQDRFLGASGVLPTFEDELSRKASTFTERMREKLERQKRGIQIGQMLPEDVEGLGNGSVEDIKNSGNFLKFLNSRYNSKIDPLQYFTQTGSPEAEISPANVSTLEDYARYGALVDLLGQTPSVLNPADVSKAGTAGTDFADIDFQGLAGLKDILKQRDQEFLNKYGNPNPVYDFRPDGTIDTSRIVGLDGNFNPPKDATIADTKNIIEVLSRGAGNLPQDSTDSYNYSDEILNRILNGGKAGPTPAPGPNSEFGGAPVESRIAVPKPPVPEPNGPLPEPPNSQGAEFFGYYGNPEAGYMNLYRNASGQYVTQDGTVFESEPLARDPNTFQLSIAPSNTVRPPDPPPHPSGYAYFGWMANGTPIYSDSAGKPIYYDGTPVQGFSISRNQTTGEVSILGAA